MPYWLNWTTIIELMVECTGVNWTGFDGVQYTYVEVVQYTPLGMYINRQFFRFFFSPSLQTIMIYISNGCPYEKVLLYLINHYLKQKFPHKILPVWLILCGPINPHLLYPYHHNGLFLNQLLIWAAILRYWHSVLPYDNIDV